jgi:acyl-coenzyme A thioesterase PaaI-like protein
MDTTAIPFARLVGLQRNADGNLVLPFSDAVHNHLGTVHASAQITLAETASGDLLARTFPDLVGRVVPVVREVRAKFRTPATSTLTAYPAIPDPDKERFMAQFGNKGRGSLTIEVELRDAAGAVTCRAAFDWFIQTI